MLSVSFSHVNVQKAYFHCTLVLLKKYSVLVGNELSGSGVGARIDADQYAADVINLKHIIDSTYQGNPSKPLVLAPGGFFDAAWFTELVSKTKPGQMDVITHHIYNLGPGMLTLLTINSIHGLEPWHLHNWI